MFSLIVMRTFCGALVSMLAVRNIPIHFRNLEDIVTHPDIKVIIEEESAITQLFRVIYCEKRIHIMVSCEYHSMSFCIHEMSNLII